MIDERIPIIAAVSTVAIAAFLILRKHEITRLHRERGYDAHDPNLEREAHLNTKAKFRTFNEKARRYLEIVRAILLGPACALIAILFFWAGWPNRWDMFGIAALFALGAAFLTRNFLEALRNK